MLVFRRELDVGQLPIDIVALNAGIDPGDGGLEQFREDIALFIPYGILGGQVAVAKPNQMVDAGDFDS